MSKLFHPPTSMAACAGVSTMQAYYELYRRSIADPNGFWLDQAKRITWKTPPTRGFSGSLAKGDIRWFEDGTLNASFNCLDRHDKHKCQHQTQ